jgi:S1-C subfamily serine protease
MRRALFTYLLIVLIWLPVSSQESLPDLAKRIKPSVVTILSIGKKRGMSKSGSGFFVAQRSPSFYRSSDDVASFARRVKSRFEEYNDLKDEDLVRGILERTPEYRNKVKFPYPLQELAPKIIRVNNFGSGSLIVTNWHVVAGSKNIVIRTQDKQSYAVLHVIAYSVEGDLALLQTNAPADKYQPLEIAGAFPDEGERVLVIGNPLGLLEGSLSDGIISSLRRVPNVGTVLQITAPVSPGNSGSPVVNTHGQVVGVVTLSLIQGQNLNFAMPWLTLARMLNPEDPLGLYAN